MLSIFKKKGAEFKEIPIAEILDERRLLDMKRFFKRIHLSYVAKYFSDGTCELWAFPAKKARDRAEWEEEVFLGKVKNNEFKESTDFHSLYLHTQRNAIEMYKMIIKKGVDNLFARVGDSGIIGLYENTEVVRKIEN